MKFIENYSSLVGRLLIATIFLMAGISKISGYTATQGYMEAMGVSGALLPLVIATEIVGAIAIIIGYKTKIAAFLLAGFSVLSALLFHCNLDTIFQILKWKSLILDLKKK